MEPWKLGVIALLLAGAIGYGVLANGKSNPVIGGSVGGANVAANTGPLPAPTPSKYAGKTLPDWPTIKQWVHTPSPVHLGALKGKPVMLEVFRTECSHCQEAAPFIDKLYSRYAPRGVQFVGIQSPGDYKDKENPENDWNLVKSWMVQRGYKWPVGFDEKSAWFQGKFGKDIFYPSMFLIGSNGKVRFFQSGFDERKGLELGIQMENLAPGSGDAQARSEDLSRFLASSLGIGDDQQKQLSSDLLPRLGGKAVASQPQAAGMFSPALLLLSAPVGIGLWGWQRRNRAKAGV